MQSAHLRLVVKERRRLNIFYWTGLVNILAMLFLKLIITSLEWVIIRDKYLLSNKIMITFKFLIISLQQLEFDSFRYLGPLRETSVDLFWSILSKNLYLVISIDIAVVAHSSSIKNLMLAIPRSFIPTMFMIAVVTETFCIVLSISVFTFVHFFPILKIEYIFFLRLTGSYGSGSLLVF